ncbi:MAG: hypothetical protein ABIX01_10030 [Chitinophagaceae bacterium]
MGRTNTKTSTNAARTLRMALGITIKEMAGLFSMGSSQMAMAETDRRTLPASLLTAVNNLHNNLQKVQLEKSGYAAAPATPPAGLSKWKRATAHRLKLAEEKIDAILNTIATAEKLLALVALQQQEPFLDPESIEALELTIMGRKASKRMQQANGKRLWLQVEIAGLQAQMAVVASQF